MAYADFTFYTTSYFGNVVPESDFPRLAERASDWIDVITFDRLTDGLPVSVNAQAKIKKAVCALTDVFYQMELAQKKALSVSSSCSAASEGSVETSSGIILSKSSGSESISYASPQQTGAAAKEWNAVFAAAGNPETTNKLLKDTVKSYLLGVKTDKGVPLLYAGYDD